jgi:general secretion pathway protein D
MYEMGRVEFIFSVAVLAVVSAMSGLAAEDAIAPVTCGNGVPGGVNCLATKLEKKQARQAYDRGRRLEAENRLEDAYKQFDEAARLVPHTTQYLTARELVKARLVFNHIENGNTLLLSTGQNPLARIQAVQEFHAALVLDPGNQYARERLQDATLDSTPLRRVLPEQLIDAGEIRLQPQNDQATFHYSGDVHGLFEMLAAAYGMKAQFDESVQNRKVRFDVDNVGFFTALRLACDVSKTMWSALDAHQVLIAADNLLNHKQFDRMSLRTFILPPHSSPSEAQEFVNTLRTMFDLRFIQLEQATGEVQVRASQPVLRACDELLDQLSSQRPQVMFDMQVFQISHQITRNIGMHIPQTFNLYNIPAAALAGLAGQNIQQLINQLVSSGAVNQLGSAGISGLLAQLMGSGQNSIFSQPLATFGGGLTFMGLSLDQLAGALSVNESWARSLEHVTVHTSQGQDATLHIGERYPIENASYAPIYNSPQIAQVLGNQSYIAPFPSVTYEDLGLNVKAKPVVHGDDSVSLTLQIEVRSLTGASANGIPVISNREYNGSISLKDGDEAVVAGEISRNDTYSMTGIPGLGFMPILKNIMANNTKEEDDDELMIIITPHILSSVNAKTPAIWISEN